MKKGKRTITPYDDYNSRIPHKREWDFIGIITPNCGTLAIRNGWKIIEMYEYEEENNTSKYD